METEYRVWCKNNNEWEKDLVVLTQEGKLFEVKCVNGRIKEFPLRQDTHILQFYTGLNDSKRTEKYPNGQKIFVGSIVKAVWYSHEGPENETFGEVVFNNGWLSYCIWDEFNKTMSEMNGQGYYKWEIEVLGNIFENSDLLEGNNEK